MRTFQCSCGNQLFFDNSICIKCQHAVGWCPKCRGISDVTAGPDGGLVCSCCSSRVAKCYNYGAHNVCNRFIFAPEPGSAAVPLPGSNSAAFPIPAALCDCCRFNHTVPDLRVKGNQEKWYRLEAAKRRVLYDLTMCNFPFGNALDGVQPALLFEFKADIIPNKKYRGMESGEKVYTGHDHGTITINIQEADDAAREKLRVAMKEAQRTLVGHYRHELGHYIWDVLIKDRREQESIAVFGDHNNPNYGDALTAYYANGPKPNWLLNYVSAYATMHPWEDFAETFALYLDMVSSLDTAQNGGLIPRVDINNIDAMAKAYQELGIAMNEMNRSIGFLDYVPEVIACPVLEKLRFIHDMPRDVKPMIPAVPAAAPAVPADTNPPTAAPLETRELVGSST